MATDHVKDLVNAATKTSGTHGTVSLLSLPTELRLQIYKYLPIRTFVNKFQIQSVSCQSYDFSIVTKGTTIAIPATFQQIRTEASVIMAQKMNDIIQTFLGILIDVEHLPKLVAPNGPLLHIDSDLCLVAQAKNHGSSFSLSRITIIRPTALISTLSDRRRFALSFRKLTLILEKQRMMSESFGTEPLGLDIGLRNRSNSLSRIGSELIWRHEAFAAHLRHQYPHRIPFQYTLRPVVQDFPDIDINTYYITGAARGWDLEVEQYPVFTMPGETLEEEEFEER